MNVETSGAEGKETLPVAIIDVLKWDAAPRVFAYRFENCELNYKSQLIVTESQEAVLVKEGLFYRTRAAYARNEELPFPHEDGVCTYDQQKDAIYSGGMVPSEVCAA